MSPERWARIQALFVEVKDLEPEERVRRLGEISRSDPELHSELESILDAHDRADELLDSFERLVSQPSFELSAADEQDLSTPDPHGLIGRTISHYEVTELLGAGGMGVLYKATDTRLGRTVALKFLPPQWSLDAAFKARFEREARAVAALDHPNICNIHEIGETEQGQLFIAMAFYDGETVKEKIARGPLAVEDAVDLAEQAASGLAAAHRAGLVHRDVKPANLMVTEEGVLKILDFGLAKTGETALTESGMRLGTPAYMSPEQTRGEEVDAHTDLWSLGVVLYEMLTAQRPFRGDSSTAVIHAIRHEEPEQPGELREGVPEEVAGLVLRLLSKDPKTRYAGAELLSEELATSAPAPPGARGRLWGLRRSPWLALGSSAAAVALAVALGVIVLGDRGPAEGAADANTLERPLIVVLPFENRGPAEQEYFAAGVTDEITSRLAANGSLGVLSRTSAIRYARSDRTGKEIGEDLGVDYILEGSVRWAEGDDGSGRVRVTTQLIRAADDTHIWAQPYDREIADIFQIQSEIAGQVVERIGTAVGDAAGPGTVGRPLAGPPTEDLEAYSLYMRGRFHRQQLTREGLEQASEYLQRAIDRDPGLAQAYAELVRVDLAWQGFRFGPSDEIVPRARAALAKALDLDASAPEVQFVLGRFQMIDGDWRAAEETYRRLIELSPSFAEAHSGLAEVRGVGFGDLEAAVRKSRLATLLDPLSPAQHQRLSRWLYHAGDYEGAIVEYERILELDPEFRTFAAPAPWNAYSRLGRYEEAIRETERHNELYPDTRGHGLADLAAIYAEAGRRAEAIQALTEAKATGSSALLVALAYAVLGEPDSVFAYLEDVYWPTSAIRYVPLKRDPRFEPLRSDPRWAAVLERLRIQWGLEW
jgi:TolB-like protein/tetratricopeptide (TPR) repeat protein